MKKNRWINLILILFLLAGLFLLLYPTVSDYWNSLHQSKAITVYADSVAQMDDSRLREIMADAEEYNRTLLQRENQFALTDAQKDA